MGPFLNRLNMVLNAVFAVSAAGVLVLAVLSLVTGPTLHYAPYVFALCGVYYLGAAVKVFAEGGRRRLARGIGMLILALVLAALTYVAYGSVA